MFLDLKGLSVKAKKVQAKFDQVLASPAISCSTMTKNIRNDLILQNEPEAEDRAEDQGFSIAGNAILEALEMMPFTYVRQIAKMTIIPPATVFRRWMKSLRFVLKRL
jgi:hypothetical protein